MVTSGWGIPPVCVRHGRPAVAMRKVSFVSRTPLWAVVFLMFGLVVGLIVMLALQKRVTAPAWPVCDRCLELRRSRLTTMWLLLLGGPAAGTVVMGLSGSQDNAMGALGLLVGWLALPLVGLVVGSTGAWGSVLAASVEKTGQAVNFREPSAAFTQLLPGMSPAGR